jgi:hypothetical protein
MQQGNKQTAVSEERQGKHVPAVTNTHETIEKLCFGCGALRGVILKTIKMTSSDMFRMVAAVQQFMTEFNCAVSEEEKMVAITKIVSNLMKQNDH